MVSLGKTFAHRMTFCTCQTERSESSLARKFPELERPVQPDPHLRNESVGPGGERPEFQRAGDQSASVRDPECLGGTPHPLALPVHSAHEGQEDAKNIIDDLQELEENSSQTFLHTICFYWVASHCPKVACLCFFPLILFFFLTLVFTPRAASHAQQQHSYTVHRRLEGRQNCRSTTIECNIDNAGFCL